MRRQPMPHRLEADSAGENGDKGNNTTGERVNAL